MDEYIPMPKVTAEEMRWKAKARCSGFNPDEFFPTTGKTIKHLKEFCEGCEVKQNCLDFALDNKIEFGVWGGTSPLERKKMEKAHAAVR